ncbi:MAG: polysaccharide export protein [Novosphingobium sp.]
MKKVVLAMLLAAALSSCAEERFVGRPGVHLVDGGVLPPPTAEDFVGQGEYRIGPSDKLAVNVYGVDDLSQVVTVDSTGDIALPLIGSMKVAGQTPEELSAVLRDKLKVFVKQPRVSVNPDEINQTFTVDGQVTHPGMYPLVSKMTLIRAVARAEGANEYAREDYIVVFRKVGGRDMAALYDLRAIRQGIYPDPNIYANDVIYVGESHARRLFQSLIQGSPLLITPLVALLQ